jgi:hypothetical protein
MNFKEYYLLREAQSIYYHYTYALHDILTSDCFELSNALTKPAEARLLPKGFHKPYYLSMSRNPSGSYKGDQLLVLDGDRLSQKYQIIPTNYSNCSRAGTESEMEDRLWSREPIIPNAREYIKEIHLFVPKERLYDKKEPLIPSLLQYLKIPFYIYTNRKDLFLMNKKKALEISDFENLGTEFRFHGRDDFYLSLIEFLETGKASKHFPFKRLKGHKNDFVNSLSADLRNMASEKGVLFRELNRRLVDDMKKSGEKDLSEYLKKKYEELYGK